MAKKKILTSADVDTETDVRFGRKLSKVEKARRDESVARLKRIVAETQAERAMLRRLAMLPTDGPSN